MHVHVSIRDMGTKIYYYIFDKTVLETQTTVSFCFCSNTIRQGGASDRKKGVASSLIPALGVSCLGLCLGDGAAGITGPADGVRR